MKKLPFEKIIIFSFAIQIIVDCLHSATIFPFIHFGMYSEIYKSRDVQLFEIKIDGQILSANDFGIITWDMIHIPLTYFKKQTNTSDFSFDKDAMGKVLKMAGLQKVFLAIKPNLNNTAKLSGIFPSWYKTYLIKLLGRRINTVEVNTMHCSYKNSGYILLNKEQWIKI